MTGVRLPLLTLLFLALQLSACSEGPEPDVPVTPASLSKSLASQPYRLVETFEVGTGAYVRTLAVDPKTQTLWVGTSIGALAVDAVSGEMKARYTRDQGLANEYVFAVMTDQQGGTWFGTNGGGASRLGDGRWQTFFPMHGLADYWVYAFTEQADGTVWIGTWAGLNAFDPVTGTFRTYLDELVNEWVYGLAVDDQDRVWIGTEGGVNMFDGKTWKTWTHTDGLGAPNTDALPFSPNTGLGTRNRHDLGVLVNGQATYNPNYVFDVLVAADGSVWAGTWGGGASRFDGQAWQNFTRAHGLAGNIVYSVAEDAAGRLWFGTDGGLSVYDGDHWTVIDRDRGLLDNHVYAVATGPAGHVWAGTRGGVAHIVTDSATKGE